jgi:hypothetical protein
MGSMNKYKNDHDINLWKNKNKNDRYFYSDKLDGISALYVYHNK